MGRTELGRVDPSLLIEEVQGERRLLLGGRSWRVTYIDWRRRRCFVEPADGGGRARWMSLGRAGLSYELTQAMRAVLLGEDPPVRLTKRAVAALEHQRAERAGLVHPGGTLIVRHDSGDVQWWTWAGFRANATLAATLSEVIDPMHRFDDRQIRLRDDLTPAAWRDAVSDAASRLCLPEVSEKALVGLKFSAALPKRLAMATHSPQGSLTSMARHAFLLSQHASTTPRASRAGLHRGNVGHQPRPIFRHPTRCGWPCSNATSRCTNHPNSPSTWTHWPPASPRAAGRGAAHEPDTHCAASTSLTPSARLHRSCTF
jgi:ATP-dependent Lhr-like helicase